MLAHSQPRMQVRTNMWICAGVNKPHVSAQPTQDAGRNKYVDMCRCEQICGYLQVWRNMWICAGMNKNLMLAHSQPRMQVRTNMWGWPEPYIYTYIRCIYDIFSREITIHTIIYGVHIGFWPTLQICGAREAKGFCRPSILRFSLW